MSIHDPPLPQEDQAAENAAFASADAMNSRLEHIRFLSAFDCYWDCIIAEVEVTSSGGDVAEYEFTASARLRGSVNEQDGLALGALLRRLADLVEGGV